MVAEDAGYGVIGELSVYDSPVIQIQTWLHISPTIRRGRDTSFRGMSLRLNTKKLKMVITPWHIKSYLFRLLLPVKKELSLFPTIKLIYVFQPKLDLVHEYRTKFRHTENVVSRPMLKFEG